MISASVIADSVSPDGFRLVTIQSNFHRFILAEINTHRVFSRNYRSSRAVPVKKLIEEVRKSPAMPVYWGLNQPGMGTNKEIEGINRSMVQKEWINAANRAASSAEYMMSLGLAKEAANRVLEPFLYVPGLISSTDWMNFFGLRLDKAAQPEARAFAEAVWRVYNESKPKLLKHGEWHLPYIDDQDEDFIIQHVTDIPGMPEYHVDFVALKYIKQISAARCARVSYKVFEADRKPTIEEDLALYDKLVGKQPYHASPLEHVATPDYLVEDNLHYSWNSENLHGNFTGWCQFRKELPAEWLAPLPEGYDA